MSLVTGWKLESEMDQILGRSSMQQTTAARGKDKEEEEGEEEASTGGKRGRGGSGADNTKKATAKKRKDNETAKKRKDKQDLEEEPRMTSKKTKNSEQEGSAARMFNDQVRSFGVDAGAAADEAVKALRSAESAAGMDPAALKQVLSLGNGLVRQLSQLVKVGAQLLTRSTSLLDSSTVSRKKASVPRSRKMLESYKPTMEKLALERSPFHSDWVDDEDDKCTGLQVLQKLVGEDVVVEESQLLSQLMRLRSGWSSAVQSWLARKVSEDFPSYKDRDDAEGWCFVVIQRSHATRSCKQICRSGSCFSRRVRRVGSG